MKKLFFIFLLMSGVFAEPILKFYCGTTMAPPLKELASKFEKQNKVKIVFITGVSKKLYKQILDRKDADVFLSGMEEIILNDQNGLFTYKKLIGYNKAVILVQKGNPKGIRDLNDFIRPGIRVVLGLKNHGSIGKIAQKILTDFKGADFYEKVYKKALKVATALDIMKALKNNKADTSIGWRITVFMNDNDKYIDYLDIPYIAPKRKLYLSVVKYSQYPELSKKFVDFVFKNKLSLKKKGF